MSDLRNGIEALLVVQEHLLSELSAAISGLSDRVDAISVERVKKLVNNIAFEPEGNVCSVERHILQTNQALWGCTQRINEITGSLRL